MTGRNSRGRRLVLASAALLAPLTVALEASADDTPERIVVTTMRAPVDWLGRADGVARFSGEEVERVNADHIQELLNRAPGVMLHRGSGVEHLTAIRSPVLSAGAGAGSFLFLEDGVPLRSAGFANINGLFEAVSELAGSVEVVRGPGSVLYGSNAVHGTINVVSRAPIADGATVELSASTLDRNKGSFELSRAFDRGGVYAGLTVLDEGGWRDAADLGVQKALLRWDASGGAWSAATTLALVNINQETAGFAQGDDAYKDSSFSQMNANPDAYRDARAARLQSRMSYVASDDLTLAFTPYARWNEMEFLQHFLLQTPLEESGHWSVGSLLTAYWEAADRVSIVAGVDLERSEGYLSEVQSRPTLGAPPNETPQGVHYDYEIISDVAAVYADADIELSENWSVQVGARGEWTRYDYDNMTASGTSGRVLRPDDRVDEFDTFTPKAALLRRIGASSVAYVRYSRGARAPQTTDAYRLQRLQVPGEVEPETLDSYELGWRGAGDLLSWDVAAFTMEKDHYFFRDAAGFNVSDGRTRHQGVEAQFTVPMGDRFEASLAGTYAQHTWQFDHAAASPASTIVDGENIDEAPEWLANGRLRWFPTDRLDMEAEWLHVGEYFLDEGNTATYPGHDLLNLRATWEPRDGLALFLIVRNALNTDYAERGDFAFGNERYFPGEDRAFTFGVRKDL
jgi:outer membrane receptor protein involved in Fe transport